MSLIEGRTMLPISFEVESNQLTINLVKNYNLDLYSQEFYKQLTDHCREYLNQYFDLKNCLAVDYHYNEGFNCFDVTCLIGEFWFEQMETEVTITTKEMRNIINMVNKKNI